MQWKVLELWIFYPQCLHRTWNLEAPSYRMCTPLLQVSEVLLLDTEDLVGVNRTLLREDVNLRKQLWLWNLVEYTPKDVKLCKIVCCVDLTLFAWHKYYKVNLIDTFLRTLIVVRLKITTEVVKKLIFTVPHVYHHSTFTNTVCQILLLITLFLL